MIAGGKLRLAYADAVGRTKALLQLESFLCGLATLLDPIELYIDFAGHAQTDSQAVRSVKGAFQGNGFELIFQRLLWLVGCLIDAGNDVERQRDVLGVACCTVNGKRLFSIVECQVEIANTRVEQRGEIVTSGTVVIGKVLMFHHRQNQL